MGLEVVADSVEGEGEGLDSVGEGEGEGGSEGEGGCGMSTGKFMSTSSHPISKAIDDKECGPSVHGSVR